MSEDCSILLTGTSSGSNREAITRGLAVFEVVALAFVGSPCDNGVEAAHDLDEHGQ